ncbi:hypothetical protein [Streptomyces sp. NPDC047985]|uniref:hypothetical protein n=1 Tax=Streptomyces sp. NPDC047985 TaxID=3155384 RepID=UPI003418E67E
MPDGAAAAARATADARQGELRAARTGGRPAAPLLKERRQDRDPGPERGEDDVRDQDRTRPEADGAEPGGRSAAGPPDGPGTEQAAPGADRRGDGSSVRFVELDVERLLPPLWGQSPEQHQDEVRGVRQGLAEDRAVAKERLAAFTAGRRAQSVQLASLVPQLTQQVNNAKAAALGRIGSAETSGAAAVRAAVSSARSAVRARARAARAQVESGYAAAVGAMGTAAAGARTGMESGARAADQAVTTKQNGQLTALGELYTRTEQRIRDAAGAAGGRAVGEAAKRAEQYRAKMIHRDDNWWDGPLTDNRCKAQANAAKAVGDAYKAELPKAADEPVGDLMAGKPQSEQSVRQIADDVRRTLTTVLDQSGTALKGAHDQSVRGAAEARTAALAAIDKALGAAESSLVRLRSARLAAIRAQAAQQRQAVARSAVGAIAAIGERATTARTGLDRGLGEFIRILGEDEVPDPEQLEEVLRETGARFDAQLAGVAQELRTRATQAEASLAAAAQHTTGTLAAAAAKAGGLARQTAASSGQALTTTATRTVQGLQQVQQGFAQNARQLQTGHGEADQQILQGLDAAYTELAAQFAKGSDGQVAAIAQAFDKAATVDIHPKIDEEAKKARDKVKPRWKSVLTILIVIVVVIALTIALGPLVIGAVTAGAAALGAGAAAAAIGTIVGGAIVGAAAGAVGQVVSNALNGQPLLDGVLKAAVFGAIGGAIGGGVSASVAKTALSTGVRVGIEMASEVVVELGLGAANAAISGQQYTWQDALLGVATTVAVTGVMANPRVQAMTQRVQVNIAAGLGRLGIQVPSTAGTVDAPDAPRTPDTTRTEVTVPDAPSAPRPGISGPGPDGGAPGGTPNGERPPGRGPDGATSWDTSDIDPTGGSGSADGPVRPSDQVRIEAELRVALGALGDRVDVTIDPDLPGRTVRVHYDLGEDGLIGNIRMRAGPSATPADIRLHAPTAQTMLRYGGLTGRVRQILRQLGEWVGLHGSPPVGSRAWEARLELEKLPRIIADRARACADADPALRAQLEAELTSLASQVEAHANTLREWNTDPGRGYVAAEPREELTAAVNRLPDEVRAALLTDGRYFRLSPSGSVLELRVTSDRSVLKRWDLSKDPPAELPEGTRVEPKRFSEGLTREEAFDQLGGNDPAREFGAFIKLLEDHGLIPDKETFIRGMQEPGGLTHRTVRSNAKDGYVQQLAEKLTHAELLTASKTLGSGDQGSLGEAWYAHHYAQNATPQVTVTPKQAEDSGFTISTERRIDLLDGNTIREIKNITLKDETKYRKQLQDLVNMIGRDIPVGDGHRSVDGVVYSILDPIGFRTNADWLLSFLAANEGLNLRLEVFNASGQRAVIHAGSGLDFSLGLGGLSPDGCGGKPLDAWLGDRTAPDGGTG